MKKLIVSISIVLILLVGYFVGIAQLDDDSGETFSRTPAALEGETKSSSDYATSGDSVDSYSTESRAIKELPSDQLTEPDVDPTGDPLSKYIVKTGTIEIEIKKDSLTKSYDKLIKIVKDAGGYIESDSSKEDSATLTVRIPAEKLDDQLVEMRDLGKITSRSMESSDQGYFVKDYEARLKILNERKSNLLTQLASAKSSDTAYLQEQILQVQSEIEYVVGEQELLNEKIAMSTIEVTLFESGTTVDDSEKSLLAKSWENTAKSFLTSIGGILIVIGATFPFLIAAGIILVLVLKKVKGKKKA